MPTTENIRYWNRKGLKFERGTFHFSPEKIRITRETPRGERGRVEFGSLWMDVDGTWVVHIEGFGDYRLKRHDREGAIHYVRTEHGAMNTIAELVNFLDFVTI